MQKYTNWVLVFRWDLKFQISKPTKQTFYLTYGYLSVFILVSMLYFPLLVDLCMITIKNHGTNEVKCLEIFEFLNFRYPRGNSLVWRSHWDVSESLCSDNCHFRMVCSCLVWGKSTGHVTLDTSVVSSKSHGIEQF